MFLNLVAKASGGNLGVGEGARKIDEFSEILT
jgi:hypothetical protein